MLKRKELLEKVEEQYRPILKEVNIADFTKCIAQFSGLHISKVADSAVEEYLIKWAKNKYRFYQLLGNKLRKDFLIKYKEDEIENRRNAFNDLAKEYPAYALWLSEMKELEKNKVENRYLPYRMESLFRELFPSRPIEGMSLTHFFKNFLSAPEDLVTKIGRVFENQEIEATYTISIDPVDMMLASENPYNWTSCYRMENNGDSLHADGVVAALLDNSSLITYIWNREGEFSLYENYYFKNVRYKKMRQYISISPTFNSIHFNSIYPGKSYPDSFEKMLREIVENLINTNTIWVKNSRLEEFDSASDCDRKYLYGYNEFCSADIVVQKDSEPDNWKTYNEEIICPCGCGNVLYGSDDEESEIVYNGEGFTAENAYYRHYCELIDGYCDDYDGNCEGCAAWNREYAVCELNESHYCEGDLWDAEHYGLFDPYESNVVHCSPKGFCKNCPFHKDCINAEEVNPDR